MSLTDRDSIPVDLSEASRQLELAIHDARVAFDCIALENLDQAHTSVITARAAIDSAGALLAAALGTLDITAPPPAAAVLGHEDTTSPATPS